MIHGTANNTLKVRMVTHVTSIQSLDIGDVEGHAASLARFSGLAFQMDDTIGTVSFVSLADYTRGAGTFTLCFRGWFRALDQVDRQRDR
jgi:hypothetical protein